MTKPHPIDVIVMSQNGGGISTKNKTSFNVSSANLPFVNAIIYNVPSYIRIPIKISIMRDSHTFSNTEISNKCSHDMSVILFPLLSIKCEL